MKTFYQWFLEELQLLNYKEEDIVLITDIHQTAKMTPEEFKQATSVGFEIFEKVVSKNSVIVAISGLNIFLADQSIIIYRSHESEHDYEINNNSLELIKSTLAMTDLKQLEIKPYLARDQTIYWSDDYLDKLFNLPDEKPLDVLFKKESSSVIDIQITKSEVSPYYIIFSESSSTPCIVLSTRLKKIIFLLDRMVVNEVDYYLETLNKFPIVFNDEFLTKLCTMLNIDVREL